MRSERLDADQLDELLSRRSGLLGRSETSEDMGDLQASSARHLHSSDAPCGRVRGGARECRRGGRARSDVGRARQETVVEVLEDGDIVAVAQCIAIDADAFPYESARFGRRSSRSVILVVREPEARRVTGFLAAHASSYRLEVHGLAVDRLFQRRGAGRQLVRAGVAEASSRGLLAVLLHVSVRNAAAIALYLGEGFRVRRRLHDFYPESAFGPERDAFEMVHPLRPY